MTQVDKQNLEYVEETKGLKEAIEGRFIELGKRLKRIRDERLFEPQYHSFDEWLPEMKMSQPTISKLINIYDRFVTEYGISEQQLLKAGGWTVIAEILPVSKTKEDAKEWIEKAENLTRTDLRAEIKEHKTGKKEKKRKDCEHRKAYDQRVCPSCGLKVKLK